MRASEIEQKCDHQRSSRLMNVVSRDVPASASTRSKAHVYRNAPSRGWIEEVLQHSSLNADLDGRAGWKPTLACCERDEEMYTDVFVPPPGSGSKFATLIGASLLDQDIAKRQREQNKTRIEW